MKCVCWTTSIPDVLQFERDLRTEENFWGWEIDEKYIMYHDCPDLDAFDLSQIFIDERYQGKGYGKVATKLVLEAMKHDGKYSKAVLCYIEGNDAAKKLYESFGFVEIDRDEDEIIMELVL